MNQQYIKNDIYEILTPTGWKDFSGVIYNENAHKPSRKLTFSNGSCITATEDHKLFSNQTQVVVKSLQVGDNVDSVYGLLEIVSVEELVLQHTYEIFNADEHVIIANKIYSHQCDELAHLQPNIAVGFWTSISPTLATGGRAIITSTPNTDEDMFATIWKESQDKTDEFGNVREDGLGRNGFFGFRSYWQEHPDRDEVWKQRELNKIGEENFRREFGCEFLVYDETLINSIKLAELYGREPTTKLGQTRWYKKPSAGHVYLVALDPSMGTGGDNAAIQVFELPEFVQIAEWYHNITPIQGQVKVLREILKYIQSEIGEHNSNSLYWSCENNTVGEAALIVINDIGEDSFPGYFLSEPIRKGHVRKFRKGFNTTYGSKISACSRLKFLIEEDRMKINSYTLISELKTFVAVGTSFRAKSGQTDDLVSSLLLVVRMSVILADWDPKIFESISVNVDEEWDAPMPIFISTNNW